MKLTGKDFRKGFVKIIVDDPDDLWYLSHIITPGDIITGKTTRKIKIADKQVKKTITLQIKAGKLLLESHSLRILGKVTQGPDDIPIGSHHTISVQVGDNLKIEKESWLSYQKQKLEDASSQKVSFLICIFDREEAIIALTKKRGFNILAHLKGKVSKKRMKQESKAFYPEIIKSIEEYNQRHNPQAIVIASPVFYKEDLFKLITSPWKKKVALANCSSVTERALSEVIKRPEVQQVLQHSRLLKETILVDELLAGIKKNGLVAYGFKEVKNAVNQSAVSKLLVADSFIDKLRENDDFEKLDSLMKMVDQHTGNIHIISTDHDAGKQLKHLGGIAALLRFKI